MPMGVIRAPGILWMPEFRNHWVDSLQKIKCIGAVLARRCAVSWSFAHGGIMGVPILMIRALGILGRPELSNHWADYEIKFIGTNLACGCATSWSFGHGGIMGLSMGMIRAPGILWMLELCNHWADSLQIKFFHSASFE